MPTKEEEEEKDYILKSFYTLMEGCLAHDNNTLFKSIINTKSNILISEVYKVVKSTPKFKAAVIDSLFVEIIQAT
jgi:hypothetical protein